MYKRYAMRGPQGGTSFYVSDYGREEMNLDLKNKDQVKEKEEGITSGYVQISRLKDDQEPWERLFSRQW